ncbi:MAG: AhpC/TSA family protein [Bacteroidaceae bacterium]|nr:AhpC/TSA family protein [Bacteroidaceae bacterium]
MRKLFVFALLAISSVMVAQEKRFVIKGEMSSPMLCYSNEAVKEVKLEQIVDGRMVVTATSPVVDNRFVFEGVAPEELSLCNISGFDNGAIQLFLEEGVINVGPFDAAYPAGAKIGGTPSNDMYQAYIDLNSKCVKEAKVRMKEAQANMPAEVKGNLEAESKYTSPVFYVNNIHFKVEIMDFIYRNIDSPVALYIIKYSMMPTFNTDVIQTFLDAVPQELHSQAMYKELVNDVRSANLKVGAVAPDISGRTPDGKELSLSDFKGKYVFLDFWASWCAPCRREIPYLKEALAYSGESDNLVVLSYSIDDEYEDWTGCIADNGLVHRNWVHISALKGWNSEGIKLFSVKGVPYTALIDPEGNVVQFELRGEEMVKRLKKIVDGVNE